MIPGLLYMVLIETIIIAFIRNFNVLLPMFFFFGASGPFRLSVCYVYILELTPKHRQPLVSAFTHSMFGIAAGSTIIYTEFIHSYWVPWQATIDGLMLVCTLLMFLLPESPKLLVA